MEWGQARQERQEREARRRKTLHLPPFAPANNRCQSLPRYSRVGKAWTGRRRKAPLSTHDDAFARKEGEKEKKKKRNQRGCKFEKKVQTDIIHGPLTL